MYKCPLKCILFSPVLVDLHSRDFKNHLMTNLNPLAFEYIELGFTWVLSKVSHKSKEDTRELEIFLFQNDENVVIKLVQSDSYVRPGKQ